LKIGSLSTQLGTQLESEIDGHGTRGLSIRVEEARRGDIKSAYSRHTAI